MVFVRYALTQGWLRPVRKHRWVSDSFVTALQKLPELSLSSSLPFAPPPHVHVLAPTPAPAIATTPVLGHIHASALAPGPMLYMSAHALTPAPAPGSPFVHSPSNAVNISTVSPHDVIMQFIKLYFFN